MFLQGNLQTVFDALYQMGVIDPVLQMDWSDALEKMPEHVEELAKAISLVNQFQGDLDSLVLQLEQLDEMTLGYLAMEVAREFADFHSRESLH